MSEFIKTDNNDIFTFALNNSLQPKKRNKQEEFKLQCAIIDYLTLLQNTHKSFYFFAVPNGEKRDIGTAKKLKRSGTKAGVSDLIIMFKCGKILFVELKTLKGEQSTEQKEFELVCQNLGFEYVVWRSLDDCIKYLESMV